MTDQINNQDNQEEEFSFLELFFHYFRHWKWFLLSLVVCLLLAFVYLRYTTKEYKVVSKVLIKDDKKGQGTADLSAFSDLGIITNTSNLDNEIEVLKSKSLMKEVKDSLNLGVSYYKEGRIKQMEIYNASPVFVYVTDQIKEGRFIINKVNDSGLSIYSEGDNFEALVPITLSQENSSELLLKEQVVSPWGILSFEVNPLATADFPIEVVINRPKYLPEITIVPINKTSSVVEISIVTPLAEKGKDIVNTLIYCYNQRVMNEQTYVATNTIEFIKERLGIISGELQVAEKEVERYMQEKGVTDLQAQAQLFLSSSSEYDRKISEVQIQTDILKGLKEWFQNPANAGSTAPSNVGLTDQTILSLINNYNQQIFEKERTTIGMTATNPLVAEYDARISSLKNDLIRGVSMAEAGIQANLRELRRQENTYLNKARSLPTQERESRELYRQQSTKETLVLYLMQKQEESRLTLATAVPNATVIDPADYNNTPVKPKQSIIYLAALLLGLIIPIVVIYIRDLFDIRIHSREDVSRIVKAPFLGEIPESSKDNIFPVKNVRSGIAEKFRIAVSNLRFIIGEEKGKVIMVTSTFSGEGKSFVSRNLAYSLASSGNKVLLIDIDMRKSVMDKTLGMDAKKGIAYYLSTPSATLSEVTDQKEYHANLNIIPVKVFPPNPAELIASPRLAELFTLAKERYDHIIVDTAPIGLVADAFVVNRYADATIFVTRADVSYKAALKDIQSYYADKKLNNLTTVLNGASLQRGYGYGYGEYKHNYYVEND